MKRIVAGILAHVDAGKTTLSESLLFNAGTIRKQGRVDSKDAFLDNDSFERARGITIFSKMARIKSADSEIILVDTPGHVDFGAEMERALSVMDVAILLINATDGVQAHTKTVWKLLKDREIPTFIFVNKMDLPGSDACRLLENIKKELTGEAVSFMDRNSEAFFENVATCSEELFAEYMENGDVSAESLSKAVLGRKVIPVFFGSALKNEGISAFYDEFLCLVRENKYPFAFGAFCYKIARDENGKRLTFMKITGGSLKLKDMLGNEKVNEIRSYNGEKYELVTEVYAGDICAVSNLAESFYGKVYGEKQYDFGTKLLPVITYAVKYPTDVDRVKMLGILKEFEEEEPGLFVEFSEATREIYVHLMGDIQAEILSGRIMLRYGIKISYGVGRVLYRETIKDTVEGVGHFEPLRHYAEVHLKLEPLDRGAGLVFATEVSTDDLSLNWQRLVLTHLKEREHKGVLTGSPVTDMKITLVAGKAHIKHTEGGDFRQATYRAVRQGLMQSESVLLEPYYFFEIEVPDYSMGRVLTDLDRMYGHFDISDQRDGMAYITGTAPVSTLNGYASELASFTKGLGKLSVALYGYEECHNTEEVLENTKYDPEADVRNTADSVFCMHGSGTVVPWYEVCDYMHLPFVIYDTGAVDEGIFAPVTDRPSKSEVFVTTEEIDDIINKTAYANRKGRQGSYKGIPARLLERRRAPVKKEEKEVVYKGTKEKKRFMLIDGYNVVHAWKELSELAAKDINAAAGSLMDIVSNYAGISGLETILVFDAYKVPGHKTEVIDYHNIKVVYTKTAETADRYIERYAHENGKKYEICVVTSDGMEQVIIRGEGCFLLSSRDFEAEINRANEALREKKDLWSF